MDNKKQDYIARISCATPLQLVIITYDIMLDNIALAKQNITNVSSKDSIAKTQQLLSQLITSLNMDIKISNEILPIYLYINKLLVSCSVKLNIKNNEVSVTKILTDIEIILNTLLVSWKSLKDTDQPIMINSQQLYVGLTYKKDGRLTEYISEDSSRSFKA